MNVFILFPIDLFKEIKVLKNHKVFLIEELHYFDRSSKSHGEIIFNILKPIYHRATMKKYYEYLKSSNIDCEYIDLKQNWISIIQTYLRKTQSLNFYDPVDRYIENLMDKNFDSYNVINTPRFLLTIEDIDQYKGPCRQTSFYSWIRKKLNILMNDDKYEGDKLTYDKENRKKPYKNIENDLNDQIDYTNDPYVSEAYEYVKNTIKLSNLRFIGINDPNISESYEYVKKTIELSNLKFVDINKKLPDRLNETDLKLKFPIDRIGSLNRLKYFIKMNLHRFGDYQDAIINDDENSFIFHSGVSVMMNIGLITPSEVISITLKHYYSLKPSKRIEILNSVEGFVRQIIGWREFTRYMYQYKFDTYLDKNYFNASNNLSNDWYDGNTNIDPLDMCIQKAFKFGYLHHIERLMVVANYQMLSGIDPKQVYKWFMEFSLDSYDWVMEFNIFCMATFSDGGQYTSKPYISGSNYLIKMSNYKKSDKWTKRWDNLFWSFVKKHRTKLKKNGRLGLLISRLDAK
jgi:deoxyribodipyrimidine photolyase-related protein